MKEMLPPLQRRHGLASEALAPQARRNPHRRKRKMRCPARTTHRRLRSAISSPPAPSSTATARSRQAQRTRKPARPRSARWNNCMNTVRRMASRPVRYTCWASCARWPGELAALRIASDQRYFTPDSFRMPGHRPQPVRMASTLARAGACPAAGVCAGIERRAANEANVLFEGNV